MKLLSMMVENGFVGCDLWLMKSNFGFGFAWFGLFWRKKE
jgi:hypothetical protein